MLDYKISYGIACFDRGGTRILLVKRKYTYAFFNYVMNAYKVSRRNIILLFNYMTMEEKRKVYQFNYELLWNTLWMEKDGMSMVAYYKNRRIYEKILSSHKELILECLCACENLSDSYCNLWSLPKGRKNNAEEADIDVARREFEEETEIPRSKYTLYKNFLRKCHLDNGYRLHYYIASYNSYSPIRLRIKKNSINLQFMEINGIEWMDLNQINQKCPYLKKHLKPAFNYFKKHISANRRIHNAAV